MHVAITFRWLAPKHAIQSSWSSFTANLLPPPQVAQVLNITADRAGEMEALRFELLLFFDGVSTAGPPQAAGIKA